MRISLLVPWQPRTGGSWDTDGMAIHGQGHGCGADVDGRRLTSGACRHLHTALLRLLIEKSTAGNNRECDLF